jgi:hypothetical protein
MVKIMVSTVNLGLTIPCWTYQQLASWLNQVANNIVQQVGCHNSRELGLGRGQSARWPLMVLHGSLPHVACRLCVPPPLLEAGIVLLWVSKQQHPHLPPTHNRMCCGLMYV